MIAVEQDNGASREEHRPVMSARVIEGLAVRPGGIYVDATYGRGGHARAILSSLSSGRLIVADRDPTAVAHAAGALGSDPRCTVWRARLSELPSRLEDAGLAGRIDGLLADLGVSSPQLDDPERGFGFRRDGPLDMRMDQSAGESAADLLQRLPARELAGVLRRYGEERSARRIAEAVVAAREAGEPVRTTGELAALVEGVLGRPEPGKHPATRTFQALRIAVNDELGELDAFLDRVVGLLAPGGRLAVISFHSLEDRRVKRAIRNASRVGDLPPSVPVAPDRLRPRLKQLGRGERPTEREVAENPRARSAVFRLAERLP